MIERILILVCLYAAGNGQTTQSSFPDTDRDFHNISLELKHDLLSLYDPSEFPSENSPVDVWSGMVVEHLEELNEEEQTIHLHGYITLTWHDPRLSWNTNDYGGMDKTIFSASEIWTPNMRLFNSALGVTAEWKEVEGWGKAAIRNTGNVFFTARTSFQATCDFDFSTFPLDVQTCDLILSMGKSNRVNPQGRIEPMLFMSWSNKSIYSGNEDSGEKRLSGWMLESPPSADIVYSCWQNQSLTRERPNDDRCWSFIRLRMAFRRHNPYVGLVIVLPAVAAAWLTPTAFVLPSSQWSLRLILAGVFLTALASDTAMRQAPPTDSIPNIFIFLSASLIVQTIAVHFIVLCPLFSDNLKESRVQTVIAVLFGLTYVLMCLSLLTW